MIEKSFGTRHTVNKTIFWSNVKKCLVEFHSLKEDEALKLIEEKSKKLEKEKYFYTKEPYWVANDLMGKNIEISLINYKKIYLEGIMGKNLN